MTKQTIEEAARDYARQLGGEDYPSGDRCPYNPAKSPALYAAYWQGWRMAADGARANDGRANRLADVA